MVVGSGDGSRGGGGDGGYLDVNEVDGAGGVADHRVEDGGRRLGRAVRGINGEGVGHGTVARTLRVKLKVARVMGVAVAVRQSTM